MISLKEVTYTTSASATGGRAGHVTSADGVIDLDLRRPGSVANPAANPETLFAAGYAACFQSTLQARAKERDVDTSESTVTATVSFGPSDDGWVYIAIELAASAPGVDKAAMQELLADAHEYCIYSKATRGNVDVTLTAL